MNIKLKEFKEVASKILLAVDGKDASNLRLRAKEGFLTLSVANQEYFVCVKMPLDTEEDLAATVDAQLFLKLITGLDTETFTLEVSNNVLLVKAGKGNYKLAMIYNKDQLLDLPPIIIQNKTVTMPISKDILESILNVNGKEMSKLKYLTNPKEAQKHYYIDECGCFTYTTGACVNAFTLDKPVKVLLTDRIVKLFKLFKEDVSFSFGNDTTPSGLPETKAVFETENVYLAARVNNDASTLNQSVSSYNASKRYIAENFPYQVVISSDALAAAINRLTLFTKQSAENNAAYLPVNVSLVDGEVVLSDEVGNSESITIESGAVEEPYEMRANLVDFKQMVDSYKNDHLTLQCGNKHVIIFSKGSVHHLLIEIQKGR